MAGSNSFGGVFGVLLKDFVDIGNLYQKALDGAQLGNTAFNQGAQEAIIEGLTSKCQDIIKNNVALLSIGAATKTPNAVMGVGVAILGIGASFGLAYEAKGFCTSVSTSILQGLQAQINQLPSFINANILPYATPSQAAEIAAYNAALNSGNFAQLIAIANEFARDSNFVGVTESSGGISYQQSGAAASFTLNWQPESLNIQNTDNSSQRTEYQSGTSIASIATDYSGPNETGSATEVDQTNTDDTLQITNLQNISGNVDLSQNSLIISYSNGSAANTAVSITGGVGNVTTRPLAITNYGSISGGVGNGGVITVVNLGTISGFNGVSGASGSSITNGSSSNTAASITAGNLSISTGTGSLANFGKITGNLQMSGMITNGSATDTVATIAGFINAIGVTTLSNFGSITGGVSMVAAGGNTVTNGSSSDTTALISGTAGITTAGGPASTINNFGSIVGTYLEGIRAGGAANITNGSSSDTKAVIQGGLEGWGIALSAGSVTNYGTVKGGLGCISIGSGTVTNAGVLASATPTGTAVQFGSGANKLIEKAGATISGTIFGGGGSLELANDGTPVTMTSNISVGTLIVDPGTTWSVTANANVPNIVNNGTVAIASGTSLDVSSAVDPSSSGVFQLMTKGSLELGAILGSALKIQFRGSGPTNKLTIDNASKFGTNVGSASYAGPLLENFTAGDVIDVRSIGSTGLSLNYSAASGDLQITGASGAALGTLAFQNSTLGSGTFHAAADPFGGTLITHS
jgi:hypothetical protein